MIIQFFSALIAYASLCAAHPGIQLPGIKGWNPNHPSYRYPYIPPGASNGFMDCDQNSLYVDDSRVNNVLRCRLSQQPTADTTLYFESRALRFSSCSLVFTTTNWNQYQDIPVMPSAPRFGQASADAPYQITFRCAGTGNLNGQTSLVTGRITRQLGISCSGTGDHHYRTINGNSLSLQGVGTYHMMRTNKLNVQIVQVPGPRNTSMTAAVSVGYGNNVAIYDVRSITDGSIGSWQKMVSDQTNFILTQVDRVACVELPDGSKICVTDNNWNVQGPVKNLGVTINLASSQSGVTGGICSKTISNDPTSYITTCGVADADNHFLGRYTRGSIDQSMLICAIPPPGSNVVTSIPLNPAITNVPVYAGTTVTLPPIGMPTYVVPWPTALPTGVITTTVTQTQTLTYTSVAQGVTYTLTSTQLVPVPTVVTVTVVQPTTTVSTVTPTPTVISVPVVYPTTTTITVGPTLVSTLVTYVTLMPSPTTVYYTTQIPVPTLITVTVPGSTYTSTSTNLVTITATDSNPYTATYVYGTVTNSLPGQVATSTLYSTVTITPTLPPSATSWPPFYTGVISNSPVQVTPTPISVPDQTAIRNYCENAVNIPGCLAIPQRTFYVDSCVTDVIMAGTYDIGETIKHDFVALCKAWTDYGRRDPVTGIALNSTQDYIRAGFGNNTCINSCSNQGQCGALGCYCNPGYGGADCSVNTSTLPKLPGSDGLVLVSPGMTNGTTNPSSPILVNAATSSKNILSIIGYILAAIVSINSI